MITEKTIFGLLFFVVSSLALPLTWKEVSGCPTVSFNQCSSNDACKIGNWNEWCKNPRQGACIGNTHYQCGTSCPAGYTCVTQTDGGGRTRCRKNDNSKCIELTEEVAVRRNRQEIGTKNIPICIIGLCFNFPVPVVHTWTTCDIVDPNDPCFSDGSCQASENCDPERNTSPLQLREGDSPCVWTTRGCIDLTDGCRDHYNSCPDKKWKLIDHRTKDECVWVNHQYDHPGQDTCDCVEPSDPCRTDLGPNGPHCPDAPRCHHPDMDDGHSHAVIDGRDCVWVNRRFDSPSILTCECVSFEDPCFETFDLGSMFRAPQDVNALSYCYEDPACDPASAQYYGLQLTPLSGTNDGSATNLEACIGECDSDAQCKPGLKCFQRTGFTPVPGCSGVGTEDWDYCYDPAGSIELSGGNDGGAKNLQACTGECDSDSQCASGLKCFQRDNGETIPGCTGAGAAKDWDYCYDPNWQPTVSGRRRQDVGAALSLPAPRRRYTEYWKDELEYVVKPECQPFKQTYTYSCWATVFKSIAYSYKFWEGYNEEVAYELNGMPEPGTHGFQGDAVEQSTVWRWWFWQGQKFGRQDGLDLDWRKRRPQVHVPLHPTNNHCEIHGRVPRCLYRQLTLVDQQNGIALRGWDGAKKRLDDLLREKYIVIIRKNHPSHVSLLWRLVKDPQTKKLTSYEMMDPGRGDLQVVDFKTLTEDGAYNYDNINWAFKIAVRNVWLRSENPEN